MGTHEYAEDPRSATVFISINGELVRRPEAKVSVLDAGFLLGDGVWRAALDDGQNLCIQPTGF